MEQYVLPKELDFKHLRLCLDHYHAEQLYIRGYGGYSNGRYKAKGLTKVNEALEGRTLDFHKNGSGLHLLIDAKEIFHFPLKDYDDEDAKGFSLAYERIEKAGDPERQIMSPRGVNPYDSYLPEPRKSILRHDLDRHLLEISFNGRINLKFHSWWKKPYWKYWKVVK
ncbi:MAG: hypothetical protein Q8R47_02750 [Nanoarchaeota archaeon]|nr:hypothetical protein [Nanoarchaeota archaeon]